MMNDEFERGSCNGTGSGRMSIFTAALGPIANLAGSWLQGKADKNAALRS